MVLKNRLSQATEIWLQKKGYNLENLDEQLENGATALIVASREGEINVVRDLLGSNVNINLRNNDGNNALWFACFCNNLNLISRYSLCSGYRTLNKE